MAAEESGKKKTNRSRPKQLDEDVKQVVNDAVTALRDAYRNEQQVNREQHDREDRRRKFLEIATLVFVVLTTIGVFIQAYILNRSDHAFQETARAAIDQITLTHPPKMRVKLVTLSDDVPTQFIAGQKLSGSGWVFNEGSSIGKKEEFLCVWFWHEGPLPMEFPWYPHINSNSLRGDCNDLWKQNPSETSEQKKWSSPEILKQGEIARFTFETKVPSSYREGVRLYVMGRVIYRDRLETRYPVYFARYYDFTGHRFLPADNSDYESEK
jgi:hypothetical protein